MQIKLFWMATFRYLCFVNVALKTNTTFQYCTRPQNLPFLKYMSKSSVFFCGTEPVNKYWYDLHFIEVCFLEGCISYWEWSYCNFSKIRIFIFRFLKFSFHYLWIICPYPLAILSLRRQWHVLNLKKFLDKSWDCLGYDFDVLIINS